MTTLLQLLRNKKVEFIHKAVEDFKSDFKIELPHGSGFTREDFFCLIPYQGKNYIHKDAFNFMLTNGNTYNQSLPLESEIIEVKDPNIIDSIKKRNEETLNFLKCDINQVSIYPEYEGESEHFYIFKNYQAPEWEPILKLDKDEAKYIYDSYNSYFKKKDFQISPFLSHINGELVRNRKTKEIKYTNIANFRQHPEKRLALYFYNGEINDFYILNRILFFREKEIKFFEKDYPVNKARIIYYPSNFLF